MNRIELESFMESCGRDILAFCKYLTKNKEEAEDLCQDTFVKVFETADRIEDTDHAKRFFLSVAVQLWKNRKRKVAWRRRIFDEQFIPVSEHKIMIAESEETPEQEAIRNEQQTIIRQCVDSLPEKKKIIILLYFTEGLKEQEIAEVLNLPVGTVKSRLYHAKAELAAMLSKVI